jgi:glycosyltransferase involved in cell wall biosynthesis
MSLRVALDVTPELAGCTGVARYSRELGRALERRRDWEVVRFAIGRGAVPAQVDCRHLTVPLRVVHPMWRLLGFPTAERLTGGVDVVHSLDLVAPPTRTALVLTIHDLVTSELPHLHPARAARAQQRRLAQLRRADAIVAVSKSTADALEALGIGDGRVFVAANGLTALPEPVDPPVPDRPFVLAVGTLEPRKGHELLIRAFADARLGQVGLVFAGPTAGRSGELLDLASRLGVADRLTILGHVDDPILAGLYRDARVMCMPSLAEGFGLPVLEAMAAGLPAIASDLPAAQEVAGDAAVLFPVGDIGALTRALELTVGDPALRARLRAAGPPRAADFSWNAAAQATIRAYEFALAAHG